MIRKYVCLAVLAAVWPIQAQAANFAVITTPPTMLSVLILFCAGAGLVICSQVWSVVRGGLMERVWQMFMIGFLLLLLSRLVSLLADFEMVLLPEFLAPAFTVLMAGAFVYGLIEAKRVLS